jgi:5,6-dimethylbenzimidazole synthase
LKSIHKVRIIPAGSCFENEKEVFMDVFTAIKNRRSCRDFLADQIEEEAVMKVIEAATWAPSPKNAQPWEFIVIKSQDIKQKIYAESEERKQWLLEKSGWKWLGPYNVEFLLKVPVIITIVGNPERTGVDQFFEGDGMGYQHACAAAVQNMLLAAHASGLASLWYSLYDVDVIRGILDIEKPKIPLAMVCLGKPAGEPGSVGRKDVATNTRFL